MSKEILYEKIGLLIRERRKKLKWTQDDLAVRVDMSRGSIANIETGSQRLLVHQLYSFARYLQISPADLLPEFASDIDELPSSLTIEIKGGKEPSTCSLANEKILSLVSEIKEKAG